MYVGIILVMGFYFYDNLLVVIGVVVLGVGIGVVVFFMFIEFFIEIYGIDGMFFFLFVVSLQVVVFIMCIEIYELENKRKESFKMFKMKVKLIFQEF